MRENGFTSLGGTRSLPVCDFFWTNCIALTVEQERAVRRRTCRGFPRSQPGMELVSTSGVGPRCVNAGSENASNPSEVARLNYIPPRNGKKTSDMGKRRRSSSRNVRILDIRFWWRIVQCGKCNMWLCCSLSVNIFVCVTLHNWRTDEPRVQGSIDMFQFLLDPIYFRGAYTVVGGKHPNLDYIRPDGS